MKRRHILVFAIFSLFFSSTLMAKTAVTVYCDDNYPPYSYVEKDEIRGIYTDILKIAFARMKGYDVRIKATPWKRGLRLIQKGKVFALYPPYYRPDRLYMDYSVPILEEKLMVFLNETTARKKQFKTWPHDFYGLRIGKNHGFAISQDEAFLKAVKTGKIEIQEAKDNRTNLLKLGAGRLDAYVNDRLSILWELNRLKKSGEFDEKKNQQILEGMVLSIESGYLSFTNRDQGRFGYKKDFVKTFNGIIEEMKKNGEIERIVTQGYLK